MQYSPIRESWPILIPAWGTLLPVYATDVFNSGPQSLGILYSAVGLGGFLGGVTGASIGPDTFNYTPAAPTMTDMRDGMLSAAAGGSPQTCVIWRAFAAAGVGQGASATISRRGVIKATNSFTVPVACRP